MTKRYYPLNRRRLPGRPSYVVTALRRKYAELLGWEDAEGLAHVGATLLIFSPDEDLSAIAPVRPYKANRERWSRTALEILRTSQKAMTGRELTYAVMDKLNVPRAKAAARSAKAAERSEEPRLLIESRKITGMDLGAEGGVTDEIEFFWSFKNYGRSPAWVDKIEVSASILNELPAVPKYSDGKGLRHVIVPNQVFEGAEPTIITAPAALKIQVFSSDANLFVWGRILYRDVSRQRHESRFAYALAKTDAYGDWTRLEPVGSEIYWLFD